MEQRFYQTGQFARKAAVSVRTLRYYDKVGLLSPSLHSPAGHRLYTDTDLVRLQQILALKFLGFSLHEIQAYLRTSPQHLQSALAGQKSMLREKRAQLDMILRAIEELEQVAQAGQHSWEAILNVIEVIQMEQKHEWVNKYFTPEQRQTMQDLSEHAYSESVRQKMAERSRHWSEVDQRRVEQQYTHIAVELKRLLAEGQAPEGEDAQAVAKLQVELIAQFTQGEQDIAAGLQQWWRSFAALPDEQKPFRMPWSAEESTFLAQAVAIYQQNQDRRG